MAQFSEKDNERINLEKEQNYVEHDIRFPLPFDSGSVDGVLLCHILEHFDAQQGIAILEETFRVLVNGGVVLASVPNAAYFRKVYSEDCNENWPRLFGVTDPKNPVPTFFEAALWFEEHKAIMTEASLWAYLVKSGFEPAAIKELYSPILAEMLKVLNRHPFSAIMAGIKCL